MQCEAASLRWPLPVTHLVPRDWLINGGLVGGASSLTLLDPPYINVPRAVDLACSGPGVSPGFAGADPVSPQATLLIAVGQPSRVIFDDARDNNDQSLQ